MSTQQNRMKKQQDLEKVWVVMSVKDTQSMYGGYIKEITFANSQWEIAHTYADEENMNYRFWSDVITGYENGFGVAINNLKMKQGKYHKKTGEPLANADSQIGVVDATPQQQEMLDMLLKQLLAGDDTDNNLFEIK